MNNRKIPRTQNVVPKLCSYLFLSIIIIACAFLALEGELRLAIPLLVGVTATITIVLACMLYHGERGGIAWSPYVILAVALLLRLMFLFSPPQLSDDIYRYQWDGSNLLQGINPYAAAPAQVKPPSFLSAIHSRINHTDYVTIYPPAAQVVFAGGAMSGNDLVGIKGFLVIIDMVLCALLILLLGRLKMPAWWAILYAWNPLPVLEIAGSGHVDGAGLVLTIGAFCLLVINSRDMESPSFCWGRKAVSRGRSRSLGETPAPAEGGSTRKNDSANGLRHWPFFLSGALLAGAGLVKLFPFLLLPILFLLVPARRRLHFSAGFITMLAALVLPFLPHLLNITGSLNAYARNWEFAGFVFNALRTITGSGTYARLILLCFFLLVFVIIMFRFLRGIRCASSPVTGARLALKACYAIAMAFLLLTPTLHPWYALCLVVFLPFCPASAGLVLGWAVFLTYQVQIPYFMLGRWIENPQVTAAIFWTPVTASLLNRTFSGRQWDKESRIQ